MPLPLKDFLQDDDWIESKEGKKYFVTAEIPKTVSKEFHSLSKKDADIELVYTVIKKVLYVHPDNKKEEVDRFVDGLGIRSANLIIEFIAKFLTANLDEKVNHKKKD